MSKSAELCFAIRQQIQGHDWTQTEAARHLGTDQPHLGTDQPHISELMRGRVRGISLERLMTYLVLLDRDVQIMVVPRRGAQAKMVVVMK